MFKEGRRLLRSFILPETNKSTSESRSPGSREAGDWDEYNSEVPPEPGSLENVRGDEEIIWGDDGREKGVGGKRKERELWEEEHGL